MFKLCLLFPAIDIIFQIMMLFFYNATYHKPVITFPLIGYLVIQQIIFWLCILIPVVIIAYLLKSFYIHSVWRFLFVIVFTVYAIWVYGSMLDVLVMKASFFTIFMYTYIVNQIAKRSGTQNKEVNSET